MKLHTLPLHSHQASAAQVDWENSCCWREVVRPRGASHACVRGVNAKHKTGSRRVHTQEENRAHTHTQRLNVHTNPGRSERSR